MTVILGVDGQKTNKVVPKIKAVRPFGSKVMVAVLSRKDLMQTTLTLGDSNDTGDAPQAYIVELGPTVSPESGLKVGQRVYWEGKGMAVNDPRSKKDDRTYALLEMANIRAIIEEEDK